MHVKTSSTEVHFKTFRQMTMPAEMYVNMLSQMTMGTHTEVFDESTDRRRSVVFISDDLEYYDARSELDTIREWYRVVSPHHSTRKRPRESWKKKQRK